MMKKYVGTISEIAETMYRSAKEGDSSVAIMFFDDVTKLVKELLSADDTVLYCAELEHKEIDDYDSEYFVTIDPDLNIWIEKAFVDGRYLGTSCETLFVDGNASAKIMKHIDYDRGNETLICCGDCEECNQIDECKNICVADNDESIEEDDEDDDEWILHDEDDEEDIVNSTIKSYLDDCISMVEGMGYKVASDSYIRDIDGNIIGIALKAFD